MIKKKSRRKGGQKMDAHTKAVIEEAIAIRTRMRVRDCEGRARIFRSTILETEDEEDETEGEGG